MKISELIAELEKLKEEHGDLPVGFDNGGEGVESADLAEVWAYDLKAESKYTAIIFSN